MLAGARPVTRSWFRATERTTSASVGTSTGSMTSRRRPLKKAGGGATTFSNVNGTGAKGSADTIAAGWTPLATWDERIYESVKEIYTGRAMPRPDRAVALLMGLAYLNWYARTK